MKVGRTETPVLASAGAISAGAAGIAVKRLSVTLTVLGPLVEAAETVRVELPAAAAPVLPMVSVLVPAGVTGLTLKFVVVPAGLPLAPRVTGSV